MDYYQTKGQGIIITLNDKINNKTTVLFDLSLNRRPRLQEMKAKKFIYATKKMSAKLVRARGTQSKKHAHVSCFSLKKASMPYHPMPFHAIQCQPMPSHIQLGFY